MWTVSLGDACYELESFDIGRGRFRRRVETRLVGDVPGIASISQMNAPRRVLRHGLGARCGATPLEIRRGSGLFWRSLEFTLDDEEWTIERSWTGRITVATTRVRMHCVPRSTSVALDGELTSDERALCIAFWQSAVTDAIAWWHRLQFF